MFHDISIYSFSLRTPHFVRKQYIFQRIQFVSSKKNFYYVVIEHLHWMLSNFHLKIIDDAIVNLSSIWKEGCLMIPPSIISSLSSLSVACFFSSSQDINFWNILAILLSPKNSVEN